jgi:hypothetical protein
MSTTTTSTTSETVVTLNPLIQVLTPAETVVWVEPVLEEPEEEEDNTIAAAFEDLPVAEKRDYVEVDLEAEQYEEECNCDECCGNYYDEREDYEDDYSGGLDWNESGYFD